MRFIDEVSISVLSGKGGNGSTSFRREKFVPMGGPDGGHGGRGGHVYFRVTKNLNTLSHYRGKKFFEAPAGENGSGQRKNGAQGEDIYLLVPLGTLVYEEDLLLFDFTEEGDYLAFEGGRGGLGNSHFKTSTHQAPRFAQTGSEGILKHLKLELKLLADVGLIGLPNAGKSTLMSVLSSAKPKIANYPFTTLQPQLGVVDVDLEFPNVKSFLMADLPGLIQGSSEGKGLGIQFLKHIERTKILVHLLDCTAGTVFEILSNYALIREELGQYKTSLLDLPEIICLSKTEVFSEEVILNLKKELEKELDQEVLLISSVAKKNLKELKHLVLKKGKL